MVLPCSVKNILYFSIVSVIIAPLNILYKLRKKSVLNAEDSLSVLEVACKDQFTQLFKTTKK
jgi:hypothetical protein